MLVNNDLKYVFLHNPKCGGTTLVQFLTKEYDFQPYGDLGAVCPGYSVIERHRFKVPEQYENYKVITSIRDPFKRHESLYFYYKIRNLYKGTWTNFLEYRLPKQIEYTKNADFILHVDNLLEGINKLPFLKHTIQTIKSENVSNNSEKYEQYKNEIGWTEDSKLDFYKFYKEDFLMIDEYWNNQSSK